MKFVTPPSLRWGEIIEFDLIITRDEKAFRSRDMLSPWLKNFLTLR